MITEADIHIEDEIAAADVIAAEEFENAIAYERCLPGCPHFGACWGDL
jgi:hypothetical protein